MVALLIPTLATPPDADVSLPGSKSITNRALLAAALARGSSTLTNALLADDTEAMLDCVAALGAQVVPDPPTTWSILGNAGRIPRSGRAFARQSGTTARFIAPVLALAEGPWHLDGDAQLRARPMEDLFDALRRLGARVVGDGGSMALPVSIEGPLGGAAVTVSGDATSQFLSGLLLAAPLMNEMLRVSVTGVLVSRPYVDLTISVMRRFGAQIETEGGDYLVAPSGYEAAQLEIEPDASAASYFFAAAAITGGRVTVPGLGQTSEQGDLAFVDLLGRMGAQVEIGQSQTEVRGRGALHGIEANCADLSDVVPTLAVVAAFAEGPTRITGVGFIRSKESDRVGGVVEALRSCGVGAEEEPDGLVISPGAFRGATITTAGDHRMAMAFSVMGLVVPGIRIDDPDCVTKTFPEFFVTLDALRR